MFLLVIAVKLILCVTVMSSYHNFTNKFLSHNVMDIYHLAHISIMKMNFDIIHSYDVTYVYTNHIKGLYCYTFAQLIFCHIYRGLKVGRVTEF